jgi:hypothetical protein
MYLDGAGQPIVVCNSLKSAYELLERRSGNYSDRPRFIMAQEILSGGLFFALMRHDDPWVLQYNFISDNELKDTHDHFIQ